MYRWVCPAICQLYGIADCAASAWSEGGGGKFSFKINKSGDQNLLLLLVAVAVMQGILQSDRPDVVSMHVYITQWLARTTLAPWSNCVAGAALLAITLVATGGFCRTSQVFHDTCCVQGPAESILDIQIAGMCDQHGNLISGCQSFACCCSHPSQLEGARLQQRAGLFCYSAHTEPQRFLLQERGSRPAAGDP